MKRLVRIEHFDDETPIKIYTIRFMEDGQEDDFSETEKFLKNYHESNKDEMDLFLSILDVIHQSGVRINYLRNECNSDCPDLFALLNQNDDGNDYTGNLRLFGLYYGDNKLILGNGSIKTSRTFQQDENLRLIAKDLQELDKEIKRKEKSGEIWWEASELKTNNTLLFEIDD